MRNPLSLRHGVGGLKNLSDFQNEIERWFNDRFSLTAPEFSGWDFSPACDLQETGTEFLIKADLPGIKKEDVKINVDGHRITVSGERREEKEEKDSKRHHTESFYGSFMRTFTLPQTIQEEKVSAQYKDGVLKISIPKNQPTANKKSISIQ